MATGPPSSSARVDQRKSLVNTPAAIAFGPFQLDKRAGQLMRGSESVALRPKTWSVLLHLVERAGALVTRDELLDAIWGDVAVTPSVLTKSIGELRAALQDSVTAPRLIETVPRRGFRFIAPVDGRSRAMSQARPSPDSPPATRHSNHVSPAVLFRAAPFVGRAIELQTLAGAFAKAHAGERQVVFITGPAGIGKTALIGALLDSPAAGPIRVAQGACIEQHGLREAYMPVLEALEELVGRQAADHLDLLRHIAPTWLAQMPWLIGADDERALRQSLQAVRPERMLREFAALMEAMTTDETLVLVLEDLHWSDVSTIDLLTLVAERRQPARLLLIGTLRRAEAIVREHPVMGALRALSVHHQCTEVLLAELSEGEVASYLEGRFPGSDFVPGLARLIHRHTDGNPLFMLGVVDRLLSRGHILDTAPGWALRTPLERIDLGVPDSVRHLIESYLADLSPADRAMLQAASVAGEDFTALVVAAALGADVTDVEARCEAFAQAQRLLRVAGHVAWRDQRAMPRYAFVHEVYRQAVYAQITEGQCMRLHQRIGQALEAAYGARRTEIAPRLAVHFEKSHDDGPALRYLTAAGERARLRFANREALGYFEAVLAVLARQPDSDARHRRELEVRFSIGAILSDLHGFASEPVRENAERAAELCVRVGNPAQIFRVLYARWYLHTMRAERNEALSIAAQVDRVARRLHGTPHRIVAASVLLRTALYDGRFADAHAIVQRRLMRLTPPKNFIPPALGPDPLSIATTHYAMAQWFLGYPDRALATASRMLTRARTFGHLFTLGAVLEQAAFVHLLCRQPAEGLDLAEQALSLSAEHAFAFWDAVASALVGWALVQGGRASEGNAVIEGALTALQATGARFFCGCAYTFLAEGRLAAGAVAEGLAAADAGLAMARTTLDRMLEPELWRLRGELLLRMDGQPGSVGSEAAGRRPQRTRRVGGRHERVGANVEEAERCFRHALELARSSQTKSLELRAVTSLAHAWAAHGRQSDARRLLTGICRWFGTRTGTRDLVDARTLLQRLSS